MAKNIYLTGTIKRHPDGFGFFIPDDKEHPDVYIPRNFMKGVMTSDRVKVQAFPERNSERFRGEVVEILEHGIKQVVGRFFKLNPSTGIIRDEGKGWGEDLKIKMEDSLDAQEKELVTAEIINYPGDKAFTGKIVQIIGDAADPLNDIKRVLATNSIPVDFSKATLEEAKRFKDQPDEKDFKNRKDLRDIDLITIDGATAKDFDDAVYVETNKTGFKLFVAIADVSHYVRPGTSIDRDAYERGTSVYFPNYVVPMLPEVLSNGLCSLNPHVPRLCLVAEMQMDFTGEMMSTDFYEAVMKSKARVTYGEAQEVIDGNDVEKLRHVRDQILRLADLAKILMAKRFKEGSLDLEIPETELVIDGSGVPIDIIRSARLFSHRLIEEMMLSANVAVAKFLAKKEIAAIYRIHEPPNELAIKLLDKYLHNFGGKTTLESGKLQKRLTKALEEFAGRPESQVLNILTLRSMSQAKYSPNNLGHFGLGFEYYTHFTSPIRRYPDLIVHRLLKSQVMKSNDYRLISEDDLSTAGTVLSAAEQRSVKAERQVQAIKKARFMAPFEGEEFDGIISSVTKFGIFVLLRQYDIDGLIRLDDLAPGEKFEFDDENLRLVSKRSGFSYNIGDMVRIQVSQVDIEAGQINFSLAETEEVTPVQGRVGRFIDKLRGKKPVSARVEKPRRDGGSGNKKNRAQDSQPPRKGGGRPQRSASSTSTSSSRTPSRGSRPEGGREQEQKRRTDSRQEARSDGRRAGQPNSQSNSRPSSRSDNRPNSRPDHRSHSRPNSKANNRSEHSTTKTFEVPAPRKDSGPNENLLKMILGPDEYQKKIKERDSQANKPLSKKLQFAEKTKLSFTKDVDKTENESVSTQGRSQNRKDPQERGKTADDRGGVRKTRLSQRRGKGKTR